MHIHTRTCRRLKLLEQLCSQTGICSSINKKPRRKTSRFTTLDTQLGQATPLSGRPFMAAAVGVCLPRARGSDGPRRTRPQRSVGLRELQEEGPGKRERARRGVTASTLGRLTTTPAGEP